MSWAAAPTPVGEVPKEDDVWSPAGELPAIPPTRERPSSTATTAATTSSTTRHRTGIERHRSVAVR